MYKGTSESCRARFPLRSLAAREEWLSIALAAVAMHMFGFAEMSEFLHERFIASPELFIYSSKHR